MRSSYYVIALAIIFLSCGQQNEVEGDSVSDPTKESKQSNKGKTQVLQPSFDGPLNKAVIDTMTISEMRMRLEGEQRKMSMWEMYEIDPEDEYLTWSERLFGRCCTEADLRFTEQLFFQLSANTIDDDYPDGHLTDKQYTTAYVFKETDAVEIHLELRRRYAWLEEGEESEERHISEKMSSDDTLMTSFQVSLINGYVKSEKLFKQNSRIRKMEVWRNDERMCDVELLDVPEVQIIYGDFIVLKNDRITLKPYTYYQGSDYDDVCISEFQTCLGDIANPALDGRYSAWWQD